MTFLAEAIGGALPDRLRLQLAQHPRQRLGQILGDQPRPEGARGGAVQPDGGARRFESGHALRQQAAGEARPARRRSRRWRASAAGRSRSTARPSGAATTRVGALEDDDRAERRGGGAGARELARRGQDVRAAAEQPGELALVRRQDRRAAAARAIERRRGPPRRRRSSVSASASSTIARAAALGSRQRRRDQARASPSPTPAPGPSSTALRLRVGEQRGEPGQAGKGRDHHRGRVGGVDERPRRAGWRA